MTMPDSYDLFAILKLLRMLCALYRLQPGQHAGFTGMLDSDSLYEIGWDLVNAAFDRVEADYNEDYEEEKIYLSSEVMTEFYRLCREHASLLSVKLKDEPFYRRAEEFVGEAVETEGIGYTYGVWLQTKINHSWASGLVIRTSAGYFDWSDLALKLSEIPAYYRTEIEALRTAVSQLRQKKQQEKRCAGCRKTPCS